MRWPRRQVVKPTSASRRIVPTTVAAPTPSDHPYRSAQLLLRRERQISHDDSKLVASGPTHTCCRSLTRSAAAVCRGVEVGPAGRSAGRRPRGRRSRRRRRRRSPRGRARERSSCGRRRRTSFRRAARARGTFRTGTRTTSRPGRPTRCWCASCCRPRVVLRCEVGELGEPLQEGKLLGTDRPVPVLGENDLGEALVLRVLVVVLISIKKHHEVCVGLYRATFT